MNISKFVNEVHENAVNHGWWETDRSISESIVLIHSEWSEAVEEARAGRPMVYVVANEVRGGINNYMEQVIYRKGDVPAYDREIKSGAKPEGIAVELLDGVIRIFDLFGKMGYKPSRQTAEELMRASKVANPYLSKETPLVDVVASAHSLTATAGDNMMYSRRPVQISLGALEACAGLVMWWIKTQGEDPVAILEEKHRYNITRPYKHGKKF